MSQGTVSTSEVIHAYGRAFKLVYGREPKAYYLGNQWYHINGEIVHHSLVMQEIGHLRYLAKKQRLQANNKNSIQRLIAKLRFM